ncbi:MAG: non-heme iron oxygenase ferredoxin subunit [Calditrichaeota bacterium]|nr:MAG: non-heme iron oxygenase ferredoxin subunit [Calditrichota bacterium]
MADFVTVAKVNDLQPGDCKVVEVKDRSLALYNVNGEFFCTDNICLHRQGPLGEGELEDDIVTCPWHGWQYNVKTGECLFDPDLKLETFEVRIQGDEVQVKV